MVERLVFIEEDLKEGYEVFGIVRRENLIGCSLVVFDSSKKAEYEDKKVKFYEGWDRGGHVEWSPVELPTHWASFNKNHQAGFIKLVLE